jgi:hypothetical protein
MTQVVSEEQQSGSAAIQERAAEFHLLKHLLKHSQEFIRMKVRIALLAALQKHRRDQGMNRILKIGRLILDELINFVKRIFHLATSGIKESKSCARKKRRRGRG